MENFERYERQMLMPEIGMEGQKKLREAKVLIVGAGGLGCPAAIYLAGAGVGTIGLVDNDEVSITNLHRQVLHTPKTLGVNKAESAKQAIEAFTSDTKVITYPYFITPDNAEEIIRDYDFVIDAVDNFETKFLVNDTCVLLEKPFCHAGITRFNGQALTWVPGMDIPCCRCIFEEIPEKGSVPNCSVVGVCGPAVGVLGCVQALEAIKYITGAGQLLTGRMFVFDGLTMKCRLAKFPQKSESCRVCGPEANIKSVKENYQEYSS
ncbi:MAG: HesA/MoeB/ThiF family protein [Dorea sp.]|nr:HesA/MoeB/ThiF family protein [Dorea sp.]